MYNHIEYGLNIKVITSNVNKLGFKNLKIENLPVTDGIKNMLGKVNIKRSLLKQAKVI